MKFKISLCVLFTTFSMSLNGQNSKTTVSINGDKFSPNIKYEMSNFEMDMSNLGVDSLFVEIIHRGAGVQRSKTISYSFGNHGTIQGASFEQRLNNFKKERDDLLFIIRSTKKQQNIDTTNYAIYFE